MPKVGGLANFSIAVDQASANAVLRLVGVLDAHTAPELEKALSDLLESGKLRVVLDFKGVDYVSSAGFGVLLGAIHGFRLEGGDIKVASLSEPIRRIFNMLGFQRVLDVCATVEMALDKFEAPASGSESLSARQAGDGL